jgi:hypothetical protein
MEETGQTMPSGLRRTLTYIAALAVLFVIAVILLIVLIASVAGGGGGYAIVAVVIMYLGFAPALLIPYTWRFWFVPHQMPLVTTLWRVAICGLLYPVIAIVTTVLTMGIMAAIDVRGDAFLLVYVVGLLFGILLSIPAVLIGVVQWSPKRP